MRRILLLLALLVAANPARPALPVISTSDGAVAGAQIPLIPKLKLTNGTVYRNVAIMNPQRDYVTIQPDSASAKRPLPINVRWELFPPEVRAWLDKYRPSANSLVIKAEVTNPDGTITTIPLKPVDQQLAPDSPGSLKPEEKKNVFIGRLVLPTGSNGQTMPLPDVLVSAVDPVVWDAYAAARWKKFGDQIDQSREQIAKASTAEGPDKLAAVKAAATDLYLTIYASFEPEPPVLASTRTNANGEFAVACGLNHVMLFARTTVPTASGINYYVWAGLADTYSGPCNFNEKNRVLK